jgi:hypothetical protein
MKDESHSDAESSQPEVPVGTTPISRDHPQVSRFARFVITWLVFIPLQLPFMGGDFWQSTVPQAIGAAFAVAGISWLVTVGMKATPWHPCFALRSSCMEFRRQVVLSAGSLNILPATDRIRFSPRYQCRFENLLRRLHDKSTHKRRCGLISILCSTAPPSLGGR